LIRDTKEEFGRNRQEFADENRGLRQEVQGSLKNLTDSLVQSVDKISYAQQQRLEDFAEQLGALATASETRGSQLRHELTNCLDLFGGSIEKRLTDNAAQLQQHFDSFSRLVSEFDEGNRTAAQQARSELSGTLKDFKDSLQKQMHEIAALQKQQFDSFASQLATLVEKNEKKSDELRAAVESKLAQLQNENATKLEEMRATVDEKLQGTLDKRLGESFIKDISELSELRLHCAQYSPNFARLFLDGEGLKTHLQTIEKRRESCRTDHY